MKSLKGWIIGFGVLVVLVLGGGLGVPRLLRPYVFHGMVIQSPQPAADFTLTGHMGQPVSLSDFKGQLILLYFGYTTCPDVCPATLVELHRARLLLGQRADEIQVLMVTVDPERDTEAVLGEYLAHFDPTFIGLTGTPDQIAEVATYYGIFYQRQESDSVLGYLVDHTATVTVVNREGYVKLIFPFGTPAEEMAADLAYMLR